MLRAEAGSRPNASPRHQACNTIPLNGQDILARAGCTGLLGEYQIPNILNGPVTGGNRKGRGPAVDPGLFCCPAPYLGLIRGRSTLAAYGLQGFPFELGGLQEEVSCRSCGAGLLLVVLPRVSVLVVPRFLRP
jgi:hypothetical protein